MVKLSFHLPNQQMAIYNEDDPIDDVLNRASVLRSKFLAWMEANCKYPEARELTYAEFPTKFVWVQKTREWKPRDKGFAIGRITYVPPKYVNSYYLRVLLNIVKGPRNYEEIRTVKGIVYKTYKDACYALGLLDDDKEYIEAINEASFWGTGNFLRKLFAIMLLSNSMAMPVKVWNATWRILTEDILYKLRKENNNQSKLCSSFFIRLRLCEWYFKIIFCPLGVYITDEDLKSLGLAKIEKYLRRNGNSLANFSGMPLAEDLVMDKNINHLIMDEKSYNREELKGEHEKLLATITDEQRSIYDEILHAVNHKHGGMFFVYGYGGTGKTFLWRVLGSALRSRGKIVLNVASSGIAALLLQGGRTAHSRFGIPMAVNEFSTCSISAGSHQADLIKEAELIIWDEAPMMSKHCFETLDRTMRDILKCDKVFGGKVIVFGGDFWQILPVIVGGNRVETVLSTLNSSYLWPSCKVRELKKNMRLQSGDNNELATFSNWILDIGDGKINEPNDGEVEIDIPEDLLITECDDPIQEIVKEVYGSSYTRERNPKFYQERAILSPRNEDVDKINEHMLSQIKGQSFV